MEYHKKTSKITLESNHNLSST